MRMLKQYVRRLHPRLETLLAFHNRPLTLITEIGYGLPESTANHKGLVAVRLVRDGYCQALIRSLQRPIASIFAQPDGAPSPDIFGRVRSDMITAVDYVSPVGRSDRSTGAPSVMVTIRADEELEF